MLYITADLEEGVALGEAVGSIRQRFEGLALPPGFSIVFGGAWEEQQKAGRDFAIAIPFPIRMIAQRDGGPRPDVRATAAGGAPRRDASTRM